tara:strand:- start:2256 stop:2531 length:276 start_codon:yes stop_codon:yes gene_type:complete
MSIKNKKSWLITLLNPEDTKEKLIDGEEFKTIKDFTERINKELKPYDIKYSIQTLRQVAAKNYVGGNGTLQKILKVNKVIRKPIEYEKQII